MPDGRYGNLILSTIVEQIVSSELLQLHIHAMPVLEGGTDSGWP